jgi:hypothetical protein
MRLSRWVLISEISLMISLAFVGQASAVSCSQQSKACMDWAKTNIPDAAQQKGAIGTCRNEIPKCIARCKGGNKFFVGIGGSNQYPIDTCS